MAENEDEKTVPYTKEVGFDGLVKIVLREGESWQTPFPGDEVEVHYTATLRDGTQFASTMDSGTPYRFRMGQGEVIKGWEQGIASMKRGEKAVFTIPPELGYGELGCPPLVPPNATLRFEVEMLTWYIVRDITKDGGIIKKTLVDGQRWIYPKDDDQVLVKYQARLDDGTVFSESGEEGLEFYVKDGYLCPAFSLAVKTMRMGEKATLQVKRQYAFAEKGYKSAAERYDIPPNATATLDIELVSWKIVVNVTDDRKVIKKILQEGEGYERPNEGTVVKVKCIGKLENGTIFEQKGSDEELFEFTVGEENVVDGLDKAVMTMRKGETATIAINAEYGFQETEYQRDLAIVPPNSTLVYDIQLVSFVKEKYLREMNTTEKISAASKYKEDGNAFFKAGKYQRASNKYEKAVTYIKNVDSFSKEEQNLERPLKLSCYLNNAACKLKLKDYRQAAKLCSKALEIDPRNIKALYRRAQACIEIADLEQAEVDIKAALEIDPNNRDVKVEYKALKEKQKECNKKEAKFFGGMFAS